MAYDVSDEKTGGVPVDASPSHREGSVPEWLSRMSSANDSSDEASAEPRIDRSFEDWDYEDEGDADDRGTSGEAIVAPMTEGSLGPEVLTDEGDGEDEPAEVVPEARGRHFLAPTMFPKPGEYLDEDVDLGWGQPAAAVAPNMLGDDQGQDEWAHEDSAYDDAAYDDSAYDDAAYEDSAYDGPAYDEPSSELPSASDDLSETLEEEPVPTIFPTPGEYLDEDVDLGWGEPAALVAPTEPDADATMDGPVFEGAFVDASAQGAPTPDEPESAGRPKPRLPEFVEAHKKALIIAVTVVCVLLVVYGVGTFRSMGHFLSNTYIAGCDVSGLTVEEASKALKRSTASYKLDLSTQDGFSLSINGSAVALERDEDRIAREGEESQSAFAWPVALFSHTDLDVPQNATFDDKALAELVNKAVDDYNRQVIPVTGVSIAFDGATGKYVIEGTVTGTAVDKDAVNRRASDDLTNMVANEVLPDSVKRNATADDLTEYVEAIDHANAVRAASIPVLVQGEQVAVCEPELIQEWVSVGATPPIVVDTVAIKEWATANVAAAVYHEGNWGDILLDTDKFADVMSERLAAGVTDPVEAPTYDELSREGTSREQAYENGGWQSDLGRYIDVDIDAQFARLFDDNGKVIWESAFVSGDMTEGFPTITGTYAIMERQTSVVLVGQDYNSDGKPDYESYVNYWMPFFSGFGFHDATWRSNFGGDIYQYDGSHGCLNLPLEKAEELYELVKVGDTVYLHDAEDKKGRDEEAGEQPEGAVAQPNVGVTVKDADV